MSKTFQFSTDVADPNDIELEYEIDPNVLNQKYTGFKKQYEEEEEEEVEDDIDDEEDDDDYIEDEKVNEELYDEEEEYEEDEEDEFDENVDDDYVTIILKYVLTIVYKTKKNWKKIGLYSLFLIANMLLFTYFTQSPSGDEIITNIKSFGDISKSIQGLQWQINDLNSKNKNKFHEFRHYLDSKIDGFNNKFIQIDSELTKIQNSNEEIITRLNSINLDSSIVDDSRIPIILDQENNVKILPEFATFLEKRINNIITNYEPKIDLKFRLNYEQFIEDHLQDILDKKIGFMNKEEILSIISQQFKENKDKLILEIKKLNKHDTKNLIPQAKPNQIGKINYAQAISGARIINYLTSKTFKPKTKGGFLSGWLGNDQELEDESIQSTSTSPFIVLTSNQGYWRSSEVHDTRLAIKFLEPIYLHEISYIHERVINGAILTSSPKKIELFVQVDNNAKLIEQLGDPEIINDHIKITELDYLLNGNEEQKFPIPNWIKSYLIKSIILNIPENYGNEFFTSLYKLKIHGMTRFDLYSIKKIMNDDNIDEIIKKKLNFNKEVANFGSDEVIS